jgi:16S rRNA (guanine966-N2)-methyltransferase
MRIISGTWRGRRLKTPADDSIRPTSDRVREAMFNTMFSFAGRDEGWEIDDAVVLDLFSGTGALGLEALSRGARSVTFVESDRSARALIEANLAQLDVDSEVGTVLASDAVRHVESAVQGGVDLVFADPPYGFERWDELIAATPSDRLVAESAGALHAPDGWRCIASRSYGATVLSFFERTWIQGKEDR